MPKFVLRKLVRDGLPAVYAGLDQVADLRHIEGEELWRELKRKFIEEASELPDDIADKDTLTSELADLLRVVKDSATLADIDMRDVEATDAAKTAKKGGFLEGAYVKTLETKDDDPWTEYYRKEPARYPELTGTKPSIQSIITLSNELAELGKIDRATLLPGGRKETDSHHSFSLALIAYDICTKYCPELNANLVVRYALVHDLLEIITGDEDTLLLDEAALQAKHQRETIAMRELEKRLQDYPALLTALREYEKLDTPEAATVYVLDKACTIWPHFWDKGKSLHTRGARTRVEIDTWHETQQQKLKGRLKTMPPQVILDIFEASHVKMREELFES